METTIKITEDLLVKFGFKVNKTEVLTYYSKTVFKENSSAPELYLYFNFYSGILKRSGICSAQVDNGYGYEDERPYELRIWFAHELQNLWKALTGTEL